MKYFLVLAILISSCQADYYVKTGREGQILPNFKLLLSDSATILNTQEIPMEKPFVMLLISPDCPYSKSQVGSIVKNIQLLKDLHIYIIMIHPLRRMLEFQNEFDLKKYKAITIGQDGSAAFGRYFAVTGVPFIAIYHKNKQLYRAKAGTLDPREIVNAAFTDNTDK